MRISSLYHTHTHEDETLSSLTDWSEGFAQVADQHKQYSTVTTVVVVAYHTRQTPPLPEPPPPPLPLRLDAAGGGPSCSNKLDSFSHTRELRGEIATQRQIK